MTHSKKEPVNAEVWKLLSEAGLVDITPDDFPERIREAKHTVLRRLTELLEATSDPEERESTAYSLGTLSRLETTIGSQSEPRRQPRQPPKDTT